MKTKYLIALIFLLLGTNLFTYATTRATTTRDVLTRAQQKVYAAFEKSGFYDYPDTASDSEVGKIHTHYNIIRNGIYEAGGMYYWYNDALFCCFIAFILTVTGMLIPFVQKRKSSVT